MTDRQIRWALSYITANYGSPVAQRCGFCGNVLCASCEACISLCRCGKR